jgi:hypothetical protein
MPTRVRKLVALGTSRTAAADEAWQIEGAFVGAVLGADVDDLAAGQDQLDAEHVVG